VLYNENCSSLNTVTPGLWSALGCSSARSFPWCYSESCLEMSWGWTEL